jgi:hypothetical protein
VLGLRVSDPARDGEEVDVADLPVDLHQAKAKSYKEALMNEVDK